MKEIKIMIAKDLWIFINTIWIAFNIIAGFIFNYDTNMYLNNFFEAILHVVIFMVGFVFIDYYYKKDN